MERGFLVGLTIALAIGTAVPSGAQSPRKDVVWARSTGGAPITLDGVLSEAAWAVAESVKVQYAVDGGIPGSGWFNEAGILPMDPTNATLRFLVVGNRLYLGAMVRDKSVGGSNIFTRADGFLMAIKDHASATRPAPPTEYFYTWWWPEDSTAAVAPGAQPRFRGRWTGCADAPSNCTRARTAEEIDNWNAVTVVHGTSNTDAADDWGYVVEMMFDLAPMGYDVTDPSGDIVEWNISIYDTDWFWPFQPILSSNRTWFQNPWGNAAWYHNVRIHARPDVNLTSGPVPTVGPEIRIPAADNFTAPTIDGTLAEGVWAAAPSFDIRYGDATLRESYPAVGPYRSGEVQFEVNGGLAPIIDPADAKVRWFFKGDNLYLGFDVNDQAVQYYALEERYDGFFVTITEYSERHVENHQLVGRNLAFQVGSDGAALPQGYLPFLRDVLGGAEVALALKPGTVLDTVGTSADVGYTAELRVNLTKLGYPTGRGDGRIFIGITLLDGDSFTPFTDSYGHRVWWFREREGADGAPWGYLDPAMQVGTVGVEDMFPAGALALLGNRPNPFRHQTLIRFALPAPRDVSLEVFDLHGRRVDERRVGLKNAGQQEIAFANPALGSGLYLYRVRLTDGTTGNMETLSGRMIVVR
jgi:hypothetical protein